MTEANQPPIRILLVDDHTVVRRGLRLAFDLEDDLEVVGEAANGQEALARVAELQPDVVEAGASGYMLKETRPDELFEAVRAAARGEVRLDPRAQQRLVREVRAPEVKEALTDRELEVLKLVAVGASNKGVAQQLGISEATVKSHVSNMLSKLGLKSRTQAALHAIREGWVVREP